MDENTAKRLLDLNRKFYQTFASQFSATRQRLQPGVRRVLDQIASPQNILDLGCGNGELIKELCQRGHQGCYVGIDLTREFLRIAEEPFSNDPRVTFLQKDLSNSNWDGNLPLPEYDTVMAFAVLHHMPGDDLRKQILNKVHALLPMGGRFIHSEWQFLNSERLRGRVQPWSLIDLQEKQVDPGDYLMDWRGGGQGLRYVHSFSLDELALLAQSTGYEITETFSSDGKGGNLGMYQIWKRV